MKGVQFLTDERGNPKSIVLDIEEWGKLWAFFLDWMIAEPARHAATAPPSRRTTDWDDSALKHYLSKIDAANIAAKCRQSQTNAWKMI